MAYNHIARYCKNPFWKYLQEEDRLHAYCVSHLLETYPDLVWMHPTNEGRRTKFEQFKALVLGITPGIPDIMIFKAVAPFHGLAIELKTQKGVVSPKQKEMQERLKKSDWCVLVVRSEEDFIKAVKHYLKNG